MFTNTLGIVAKEHYLAETMPFLLKEFSDFKYLIDPTHEQDIIGKCLANLSQFCLLTHGTYAATLFKNAYTVEPFDLAVEPNMTYINYRESIEMITDSFLGTGNGAFELIRFIILYSKAKGFDPKLCYESAKVV